MIQKVKILTSSVLRISYLEDEINSYISNGWQPLGEMKVCKDDKTDVVVQQMIFEIQEKQ